MAFGEQNSRKLRPDEEAVGRRVFKDTIKWWQVRISDGSGLGDSIFTNAGIGLDRIYVTRHHYAHVPDEILVHELTHVWQATNDGITGWGYKLNSLLHQGYHELRGHGRNAAYDYDRNLLGKDSWNDFSTEEQAQIVEDWFTRGESPTDPAFRYIHWCIRETLFVGGLPGSVVPPAAP
jgi:hypothetical protein